MKAPQTRITAVALLLVLGGIVAQLLSGASAQSTPPSPSTPRELFVAQCATCHGETGDGKGPTVLDRPARSFLAGGFSYGNTPEAVLRTITYGIPGSRMPSFESALTAEQRKDLAEYVIALGPPELRVLPGESVLVVRDRPILVRGKLPALADGGPEIPRGLLIGLPSGLSFEYDASDLRLLAVRSGEFVDRTDWQGRGGTALKPLGKLVRGADAQWASILNVPSRSLRLRRVTIVDSDVLVESDMVERDESGSERVVTTVEESPRAFRCALGTGWERRLRWKVPHGEFALSLLDLPGALQSVRPWRDELLLASLDQGSVFLTPTETAGHYDVRWLRSLPGASSEQRGAPTEAFEQTLRVVEVPDAQLSGPGLEALTEQALLGLEEQR